MKVLTVIGTRPEYLMAHPMSRRLRGAHEEVVVHTGQHYDEGLSDVFAGQLDVPPPAYDLCVGSRPPGEQTRVMVTAIEEILQQETPNTVLVYGDTNSALAGAVGAADAAADLTHVEAGLRSDNWDMQEEVNRVVIDHISDVRLAPTETAAANLRAEGITDGVFLTGDVQYDLVTWARKRAAERSTVLDEFEVQPGSYVLATVHRAENTDNPGRLHSILQGLSDVSTPVVLPVHPRLERRLQEYGLADGVGEGIRLTEPLGYLDFLRLLDCADRVATDSGGVQREALYLETPCVTLRDETEWVETTAGGWNILVGAERAAIRRELTRPRSPTGDPLGPPEGSPADRILTVLEARAESSTRPGSDPAREA